MSKTTFRIVVIVSLLLALGSIVCDLATTGSLPEELREYRKSLEENMTPQLMIGALAALSIVLLGMIATVGLLFFWRPSHLLYTIANILGLPLSFAFGPIVNNELTHFLTITATLLSGVIWAVIYFSPLKEEFEEPGEPGAP